MLMKRLKKIYIEALESNESSLCSMSGLQPSSCQGLGVWPSTSTDSAHQTNYNNEDWTMRTGNPEEGEGEFIGQQWFQKLRGGSIGQQGLQASNCQGLGCGPPLTPPTKPTTIMKVGQCVPNAYRGPRKLRGGSIDQQGHQASSCEGLGVLPSISTDDSVEWTW